MIKTLKYCLRLLTLSMVMVSFSQCANGKALQDTSPVALGEVYCQRWVGGIEGGGAGLNIFIEAKDKSVVLDSVYFRGKSAKLETKPQNELLYIGRFISEFNQEEDKVMGNKPQGALENKAPKITLTVPFNLKDNECVVSYKKGNKTKYFKITNVIEKELLAYPSAPPNKQ